MIEKRCTGFVCAGVNAKCNLFDLYTNLQCLRRSTNQRYSYCIAGRTAMHQATALEFKNSGAEAYFNVLDIHRLYFLIKECVLNCFYVISTLIIGSIGLSLQCICNIFTEMRFEHS